MPVALRPPTGYAGPMPSPDTLTVPIVLLDARASEPIAHSEHAAGLDLAACLPEGEVVVIAPGARGLIPTGVSLAIPPGYEGQVRPRSGLSIKHGVTVLNAPGTIDADYRGEVRVALINLGDESFTIEHGMRIAQLVIAPVSRVTIERVAQLDTTTRGDRGFGSTGQ